LAASGRTFRVLLAVAVLAAGGCFRYVPAELQAVPEGGNVRIYVTRAVIDQFGEVLTDAQPVLRGTVVRRDQNQLLLRIPVGTRQVGFHSEELGQELPIPAREIVRLETRELDLLGTGAIAAGTLGLAGLVVFVIMEAYGDETIDDVCDICVDMRVPLQLPLFR
jgi:hypothetical protein